MAKDVFEGEGLPVKIWRAMRRPGVLLRRHRRYLYTIAAWLAAIWGATLLYLIFVPESYSSRFTLILPGSGAGGTLNVESIGQAQSTASSAFSSPKLSPTENYKRLLMADIILEDGAKQLGQKDTQLPSPSIKLIDQTNLIEVKMSGSNPKEARDQALALRDAFLKRLDSLRNDEAKKREESDSKNLVTLEKKVRFTQQALLDFQAKTGLVSLDQFNNRIARLDALKEKERDARVALAQKNAETRRLGGILQLGTAGANRSMRLRSDPLFQNLAQKYADAETTLREAKATLGSSHGQVVQLQAERDEIQKSMTNRGGEITGLGRRAIMNSVDISVGAGRSNLMQAMSVSNAHTAGAKAGLNAIRQNISQEAGRSSKLVKNASLLADLMRDHRVAEAVFSSALARIDTNKQDPFASYPLVQTLEGPSLPNGPATPSLVLAIVAAMMASLLMLFGLVLLWFREPILRKITPKF